MLCGWDAMRCWHLVLLLLTVAPMAAAAEDVSASTASSSDEPPLQQPRDSGDFVVETPSAGECPPGSNLCPITSPNTTGPPHCYTPDQRCDNFVHCPDATDEHDCSCTDRIDPSFVCDEYTDCQNAEDQRGCNGCPAGELTCVAARGAEDTICLKSSQVCDGIIDCDDGSDELCFRLAERSDEREGMRGWRSEGVLQHFSGGAWAAVCRQDGADVDQEIEKLCADVVGESDSKFEYQIVLVRPTPRVECAGFRVQCGAPACHGKIDLRSPSSKQRLVGGMTATEDSWPSIVSVRKDGAHDCGGTILNSRYVMLAAHCMRDHPKHHYEVRVGLFRRSTFAPTVQLSIAEEVFIHPNFSARHLVNDIAILHLRTPMLLNRWVRPVCLPDGSKSWVDQHECAIAGWGFMKPKTRTVDTLQNTLLPLSSLEDCQEVYSEVRIPNTDQVLCAGLREGGRDACNGDSGGPIMCPLCSSASSCDNEQWTQDGIVSFGIGCAEPSVPGVYTRVQHYLPWIQRVLESGTTDYGLGSRHALRRTEGAPKCLVPWNATLPSRKMCDRKVDCLNAEDEANYPNCAELRKPSFPSGENVYHPEAPSSNQEEDSDTPAIVCDVGFIKCVNTSSSPCVPACDGVLNCKDGIDEMNCSCLLRLFALRKELLCDGMPDCPDGSDEGCLNHPCNDATQHECRESKQCIPKAMVCDQNFDCTYGEDELGCVTLASNSSNVVLNRDGIPLRTRMGFLAIRAGEEDYYKPVCTDDIPGNDLDDICKFLGFENNTGVQYVKSPSSTTYSVRYNTRSSSGSTDSDSTALELDLVAEDAKGMHNIMIQERAARNEVCQRTTPYPSIDPRTDAPDSGAVIDSAISRVRRQTNADDHCSQVELTCGERRCGTVPRILKKTDKYTGFGSQPWAVGIYMDGNYICGGTLVNKAWVLTSKDCIDKHRTGLGMMFAVGGSFRGPIGSMRIKGPFERESKVHHLQEVAEGILLLHLSPALPATSYINHLCLPHGETSWPGEWKTCAVVGYDGDLLTRHVTLTPAADCGDGVVCFEDYELSSEKCSGRWAGLIACISSNASSAQWTAVGVWHYDGAPEGCSLPTRHAKLTAGLLESIRRGLVLPSEIHSTACNGLRCPFGKCVAPSAVCDGKPDCADFRDEPLNCGVPALRCKSPVLDSLCSCPQGRRVCYNGACISSDFFCDGKVDCAGGEDEQDCSCEAKISRNAALLCDGKIDCEDQTDETDCRCDLNTSFRCFRSGRNSSCIPQNEVCDLSAQCPGGEDEHYCFVFLPLHPDLSPEQPIDTSLLIIDQDVLWKPKQRSAGLFMIRFRGKWYTHNSSTWNEDNSKRLCKKLGFGHVKTSSRILVPTAFNDNDLSSRSVQGIFKSTSATSNEDMIVVYIECL